MRRRFLFGLLLLASCTPSESATPSTDVAATGATSSSTVADGTITTLAPAEGAHVIERFSFADADSVYLLVDHIGNTEVVTAAREALETGASGDQLWAATYVWSNEGGDAEPLVALLGNEDSAIRYMAATGLIARGRIEGFRPLIEALTDESVLRGFEPPGPVWAAAATALVRFTAISENGPPFDADPARLQLAQERWRAWFDGNESRLTFDDVDLVWSTR
jgi:hypothetical protein